jgi:hypothetical protein
LEPLNTAACRIGPLNITVRRIGPLNVAPLNLEPLNTAACRIGPLNITVRRIGPLNIPPLNLEPLTIAASGTGPLTPGLLVKIFSPLPFAIANSLKPCLQVLYSFIQLIYPLSVVHNSTLYRIPHYTASYFIN